jgi:hypothetical protein
MLIDLTTDDFEGEITPVDFMGRSHNVFAN